MADMPSILSFLSRLWSGWRRPRPLKGPLEAPEARPVAPDTSNELPDLAEPQAPPSAAAAPPVAEIEPPKAIPDDDDEPEEDQLEEAEDDAEDELAPDPFIAALMPTPTEFSSEDLEQRRAEALAAAQVGEHRISLSAVAGPGTLAEALNQLLLEGRVTAEFCDNADEESHLIYRQKP